MEIMHVAFTRCFRGILLLSWRPNTCKSLHERIRIGNVGNAHIPT